MARYQCNACGYIFDEATEKKKWDTLPENWLCPICDSDKSYFQLETTEVPPQDNEAPASTTPKSEKIDQYLHEWKRDTDILEPYLADIQKMAITGESIIEAMRTRQNTISWSDILIKGAQLARLPLNKEIPVNTKTIIGPAAKQPLVIESPIYISHMSFGALSREFKIALAKGSAAAQTAICSGEGGILKEERENAYKYIFEYVPNKYSVTDENLKQADAIEIKIGQSAKPGMGGHLPAGKVTQEIAELRGFPIGKDIISPAHFPDILNKNDLKQRVDQLREVSGGRPIGIKIAAGHIEADMEIAVYAGPDFITIDGRPGATGAASKFVKEATSVPTIFALYRARAFLDSRGIKNLSLIITGGLRISADFARALALGADAVAIASAALIACGCQQYRICQTGKCPVGGTTHDPQLRERVNIEMSAQRLENFLQVCNNELKDFARLTGNNDVHKLSISDLCTTNSEISNHTKIQHV